MTQLHEMPPFMPSAGLTTWTFKNETGAYAGVCSMNQIEWYRAQGCEIGGERKG